MISILNSCTHFPGKIEKYIKQHCDMEESDTCYIDFRKVLKNKV